MARSIFLEMRSQMEEIESKMRKQLSKTASELDFQENKTIKLESNPQFGFFFRVNLKVWWFVLDYSNPCIRVIIFQLLQDSKVIQNNKNYTLLDTHKAGVRFRNQRLTDLNEDYSRFHDQYTEQQKSIVAEVIKITGEFSFRVADV